MRPMQVRAPAEWAQRPASPACGGATISSGVPSFLSGPAERTVTSSSAHEMTYGEPHGSTGLDSRSIKLSESKRPKLGQSSAVCSLRHVATIRRRADALHLAVLI